VYFSCYKSDDAMQHRKSGAAIDEIIPGKIYLGNMECAQDINMLRAHNITHIVTAAAR
jgi:hypothetical protein